MSVKLILDSTADMTPEFSQKAAHVPMTIRFGEAEYMDGVTIDTETFYGRLTQGDTMPATSQPTPAAYADAFRKAVEGGHQVLCITISSRLSGSYQSATIASLDFPGQVFVLDSRTATIGTGVLARHALELMEQGLTAEEILHILIEKRKQVRMYAVVDTLEYLKRGGRLSSAGAFVGGLLNIKPIISAEDGELKVIAKARGMKAAQASLSQRIAADGVESTLPIQFGYTGGGREAAEKYAREAAALLGEDQPVAAVGPTVGTHAGPGAIAVAFFKK